MTESPLLPASFARVIIYPDFGSRVAAWLRFRKINLQKFARGEKRNWKRTLRSIVDERAAALGLGFTVRKRTINDNQL
ncbi:MAG TPA: hypothetical protein VH413_05790 [Verrucomicrobiae bacterium]|nr:hypothetical protein [Verrucomicrobiae bacterium]